jgi:hypothetical protein
MEPNKNFAAYREHIQNLEEKSIPYIPYLGALLTDFVYFDEINNWTHNDMINFQKVEDIGSRLILFLKTQKHSKQFKVSESISIQNYLLSVEIWNGEDIPRLARLRENTSYSVVSIPSRSGFSDTIVTDVVSLSSRDWNLLLTNAKIIKFSENSVVLKQGSINNYLYRVKSGSFRVMKQKSEEEIPQLVYILEHGAIFGEMSFLSKEPTSASIVSNSKQAELWVLEINVVKKIFASGFSFTFS